MTPPLEPRFMLRLTQRLLPLSLLALAGCFAREEPLPPQAALAQAAQAIGAVLDEESQFAAKPQVLPDISRSSQPGPVSFWFYQHPLMTPVLDSRVVADFNATHGGVQLDPQFIGDWGVAIQKLTVNLAVGELPDIALVKRDWMIRLAEAGRLEDIDAIVPLSFLADLRDPAQKAFVKDGHLYGLPGDGFCSVLFYNRDLVGDAAPTNWQELRAAAGRIKAAGKAEFPIGNLPFLESLNFLLALRDDGLLNPRTMENEEAGVGYFLNGQAAMTVASSVYLHQTASASFPVGIAPIPGKAGPISRLSDSALVVFRKKNGASAQSLAAVLDYLTGPSVLGASAVAMGSLPIRESVARNLTVPAGLNAAYSSARTTPFIPGWGAIEMELDRRLYLAFQWHAAAPQ
jgi:ABC-type glycerol-3-phosphate transport system substrate-binding protein